MKYACALDVNLNVKYNEHVNLKRVLYAETKLNFVLNQFFNAENIKKGLFKIFKFINRVYLNFYLIFNSIFKFFSKFFFID